MSVFICGVSECCKSLCLSVVYLSGKCLCLSVVYWSVVNVYVYLWCI